LYLREPAPATAKHGIQRQVAKFTAGPPIAVWRHPHGRPILSARLAV